MYWRGFNNYDSLPENVSARTLRLASIKLLKPFINKDICMSLSVSCSHMSEDEHIVLGRDFFALASFLQ